jgi:hypothetical protein
VRIPYAGMFIGPKAEEVNGVEMIVITFMKPLQVKNNAYKLKKTPRWAVVFVRKQHYFF